MREIYDRSAPRRPVNLSVNSDLLARAKRLTPNLSGTVEALLADFIRQQATRQMNEDKLLDEVLAALNAFHERHGFLSDEFSTL